MSGMLHPTGPEPARTYWVRRGILLAVVLLLVVGVVLAVANLTRAAVATAPPPPLPAGNPASSPSVSVSGGSTPTPSTAVPPTAVPSTSTAPSSPISATPSAPSSQPSASAKPSAGVTVIGTPDCRPADLRVRVKGDGRLSVGENTAFTVTLVNAGQLTCLTSVTATNFELRVYSGKDRIWSSRDCAATFAPFDKKLAVKGAYAWKVTWNGERSVQGKSCRSGGKLKAGTYWATAQLKGVDPAQVRMTIG